MENKYKISELAKKANVTKRTIHYYKSLGLISPGKGKGVATYYDDSHLYSLLLIKKLQGNYLPLEEIKKIINPLSLEGIKSKLYDDSKTFVSTVREEDEDYNLGKAYMKVDLGYGVELSYPLNDSKAWELIQDIYEYLENRYEDS